MMSKKNTRPWDFLAEYRGTFFSGAWPTLSELITITKERFPKRACFSDFSGEEKRTFTYEEAWAKIQTLANFMIASGIKKGDCIAITGKNSPEWAIAYFACFFASAIAIPLDYALHDAELENLINVSKPKMIFVDEEKYERMKKKYGTLKVFSLSEQFPKTYIFNLASKKIAKKNPPVTSDDIAVILFTSGTTGKPKGVVLTHENLVSDCFIPQLMLNIHHDDIFYALLPIHHTYTMQAAFINPVSVGAEIIFGKSMAVSRLMKEMRDGKITILLGVPLLYNKLLAGIKKGIREKGILVSLLMSFLMNISYLIQKLTKKNIGKVLFKSVLQKASIYTLRVAISGGGPLSASVVKAYNAAGIDFIQGYGLTETSPIIALNPIERFKIESVGRDFSPYEEIKILHPDKHGIGEIAVKGPMVMKGYFNMPEETRAAFTDDGFFKTGDIGSIDSEHYIRLYGRAKNVIVTAGGKNVYPEEIEDAFQLCENIQQITVQGYLENAKEKTEAIEALIYPSDAAFAKCNTKRGESLFVSDELKSLLQADVNAVNKNLQPYARITKLTVLENPLEMTTSMKVKRNYKR